MNEEETKRDNLSVYQLGDRVAAGLKRLGDRDKELAELLRDMIQLIRAASALDRTFS